MEAKPIQYKYLTTAAVFRFNKGTDCALFNSPWAKAGERALQITRQKHSNILQSSLGLTSITCSWRHTHMHRWKFKFSKFKCWRESLALGSRRSGRRGVHDTLEYSRWTESAPAPLSAPTTRRLSPLQFVTRKTALSKAIWRLTFNKNGPFDTRK